MGLVLALGRFVLNVAIFHIEYLLPSRDIS